MNGFIYETQIMQYSDFQLLTFQIKSLKGFETISKKKYGINEGNTSQLFWNNAFPFRHETTW